MKQPLFSKRDDLAAETVRHQIFKVSLSSPTRTSPYQFAIDFQAKNVDFIFTFSMTSWKIIKTSKNMPRDTFSPKTHFTHRLFAYNSMKQRLCCCLCTHNELLRMAEISTANCHQLYYFRLITTGFFTFSASAVICTTTVCERVLLTATKFGGT